MRIDLSTTDHARIVGSPVPAPLRWHSEDDTAACAHALAQCAGLETAFIALYGDLGAGKTSFVRHLLRALGVQGRIKSPTYAVMESYRVRRPAPDAPAFDAWHFDFYRFEDPREWEDAGFRDVFASPGLKLAEWPERAEGVLPTPDLALHLSVDAEGVRTVHLEAHGARGEALAEAARHAAAMPDGATP